MLIVCWAAARISSNLSERGKKRRKEKDRQRKGERERKGHTTMKQKHGQQQNEGNSVWKGTHLMEVDEKEGGWFRKHPLTNMSFLTQSHLIDCPLLLCNLWGFEFWKKRKKKKTQETWVQSHFGQTWIQCLKQESDRAYLIFFSKG